MFHLWEHRIICKSILKASVSLVSSSFSLSLDAVAIVILGFVEEGIRVATEEEDGLEMTHQILQLSKSVSNTAISAEPLHLNIALAKTMLLLHHLHLETVTTLHHPAVKVPMFQMIWLEQQNNQI